MSLFTRPFPLLTKPVIVDIPPFAALYKISPPTNPVTGCSSVTLSSKISSDGTFALAITRFFKIPITDTNQLTYLETYILRELLVTAVTRNQQDSPKDQEKRYRDGNRKAIQARKNAHPVWMQTPLPINNCEFLLQSVSATVLALTDHCWPFKGFWTPRKIAVPPTWEAGWSIGNPLQS